MAPRCRRSLSPTIPLLAVTLAYDKYPETNDDLNTREERILSAGISNLHSAANNIVSLDDVRTEGLGDHTYKSLITTIEEGFPSSRSTTAPHLREFWEVRDRLITQDDIVYLEHPRVITLCEPRCDWHA